MPKNTNHRAALKTIRARRDNLRRMRGGKDETVQLLNIILTTKCPPARLLEVAATMARALSTTDGYAPVGWTFEHARTGLKRHVHGEVANGTLATLVSIAGECYDV